MQSTALCSKGVRSGLFWTKYEWLWPGNTIQFAPNNMFQWGNHYINFYSHKTNSLAKVYFKGTAANTGREEQGGKNSPTGFECYGRTFSVYGFEASGLWRISLDGVLIVTGVGWKRDTEGCFYCFGKELKGNRPLMDWLPRSFATALYCYLKGRCPQVNKGWLLRRPK